MIKGTIERERPEIAYRQINSLNQSGIKLFDESRIKFYKQYVLGEEKEEKDSAATILGSLIDFYLLECSGNEEIFNQRFGEEFELFNGIRGTGQVFTLADEVFNSVKRTVVDGEVTGDFTVCFQEALAITQMKKIGDRFLYSGKSWQKALEDFNDNGKEYYDSLLLGLGKKVIDSKLLDIGKRIVERTLNDDNVGWFFRSGENEEVLNKFPIEFESGGFECKAEIDKMVINHDAKIIQPYDVKSTWDPEEFDYAYAHSRKYYIQNGWYYKGIEHWAEKEGLGDYTVNPLSFITLDTSPDQQRPLIYETSMEHINQALNGFTWNGRRYKGINELVRDIIWHNTTGIWNISRENYQSNQIVKLTEFK